MQLKPTRRQPLQKRSRERREKIVNAAKLLLGEHGMDNVSMRSIATEAGVQISSLYQYFPDKNSLVMEIMEDYLAISQQNMMTELAKVAGTNDLLAMIEVTIDTFVSHVRNDKTFATIWAGVQANTVLRQLDAKSTADDARILTKALSAMAPIPESELYKISLFHLHTTGAIARLCLTLEPSVADDMIDQLKKSVVLHVQSVMGVK